MAALAGFEPASEGSRAVLPLLAFSAEAWFGASPEFFFQEVVVSFDVLPWERVHNRDLPDPA